MPAATRRIVGSRTGVIGDMLTDPTPLAFRERFL
jgi:hypothetical protein